MGLRFFVFSVVWSFFQSSGFLFIGSSGFGLLAQLDFNSTNSCFSPNQNLFNTVNFLVWSERKIDRKLSTEKFFDGKRCKSGKKDYFNHGMVCKALVGWEKYTTHKVGGGKLRIVIQCGSEFWNCPDFE